MKAKLIVPVVRGQASLGCTAQERAKLQNVEARIVIIFSKLPEACKTDRLDNTPCYAEMCDVLKKTFKRKKFHTIENLCVLGFEDLKLYLKKFKSLKGSTFEFTINKLNPPVDEITAGCQFELSSRL